MKKLVCISFLFTILSSSCLNHMCKGNKARKWILNNGCSVGWGRLWRSWQTQVVDILQKFEFLLRYSLFLWKKKQLSIIKIEQLINSRATIYSFSRHHTLIKTITIHYTIGKVFAHIYDFICVIVFACVYVHMYI